jgi:hypothetical protein
MPDIVSNRSNKQSLKLKLNEVEKLNICYYRRAKGFRMNKDKGLEVRNNKTTRNKNNKTI